MTINLVGMILGALGLFLSLTTLLPTAKNSREAAWAIFMVLVHMTLFAFFAKEIIQS